MRCVCVGGKERERESIENAFFFFVLPPSIFFFVYFERMIKKEVCM